MKKILALILVSLFLTPEASAIEFEFVTDSTEVKEANVDLYKEILLKKARLERKKQVQEHLAQFLKGNTADQVHDYSYRYEKKSIQKRALSCEISAASDILARHTDRKVTEDFLITQIERSAYGELPKKENGKLIWGDPNTWFVGHIDKLPSGEKASQWKMTWYGVLEKPIVKLFESYGLTTKTITEANHRPSYDPNNHLTELLQALEDGKSVQLWGDYCTTPAYEDTDKKNKCYSLNNNRTLTWYYKDVNGNLQKHTGLAWEHAFILLGYVGSIYNPKSVIVWDTNTGKHTYPKHEWMRKWEMMQYRSIIIWE